MWNAEVDCGNQQVSRSRNDIEHGVYIKCKILPHTFDVLGWELAAAQDCSQGQLLMEYLGEVITDDEYRSRMA